jgi:hypothetical protein
MNTSCQKCGKQLKLGEKLQESIKGLSPGKSLRIKCPQCAAAIVIDASLLEDGRSKAPGMGSSVDSRPGRTQPPSPPDISWIKDGVYDEEQVIEDVPLALLLMNEHPGRDAIIESIESIGYKTEFVQTAEEAIEKMLFVNYSSVVLHSIFEGKGLKSSVFHKHMCEMSMSRRRFIYYILVGKEFKTLYNLQALAHSANLVVNESEIPFFNVIIRKAIPEYEELFGPIMEEQRLQGR